MRACIFLVVWFCSFLTCCSGSRMLMLLLGACVWVGLSLVVFVFSQQHSNTIRKPEEIGPKHHG